MTKERIDEMRVECMGVVTSALAVNADDLDAWIRTLESQDSIGCYTDPTGWRATSGARKVSLKMLRAIRDFRESLEAVKR